MGRKRKSLLTQAQQKKLERITRDMLDIASDVVEEYKDLDLSKLSGIAELSSSIDTITQIHEDSPFLDEIFKDDRWKKVIKNIQPLPKDPTDASE